MPTTHVIDAFLRIEGIRGESLDELHQNEIEILTFRHRLFQGPGSGPSTAGNLSAGRCEHDDFVVVKLVDMATAPLLAACCSGRHLSKATLFIHRAGGNKERYLEIKLTDVLVSSVRYLARGLSGDLPREEVTLKYARIEWTYSKTKLDGSAAGNTMAFWDLRTNWDPGDARKPSRRERGMRPILRNTILDRIADGEGPGPAYDSSPDEKTVRESIRQDLEDLFLCRISWRDYTDIIEDGRHPDEVMAGQALIAYGLPDFSDSPLGKEDLRNRMCRVIERVIKMFEPRLGRCRVTKIDDPGGPGATEWKGRFLISGSLNIDGRPGSVTYGTEFDEQTGAKVKHV